MKKTVALLLALILLFTLSISALAYADGLTTESGPEPEPAPQPEPAQTGGTGTGDALRFSESVLNAAPFRRGSGGTGICNLGNGKTIYTFLFETLKKWERQGVKTIWFCAKGAVYEISLDDLLDSLKEAGADSVYVRLEEDGLHLYADVPGFGGTFRTDIATLQPAGDQLDLILKELANRFDENDRPLYIYEKKDDGTRVVTEYTYKDDGSLEERTMTFTSFTYNADGTSVGNYEFKSSEGYVGQGKIKYNKDGQTVSEVYNYKLDNGDKYKIEKFYNKEGELRYVEKQKNGKPIS